MPGHIKRATAKEAESERERRAKIIQADGEFQVAAKLRDAAEVLKDHPIGMQMRYLQTLVEIGAEKNTMPNEPTNQSDELATKPTGAATLPRGLSKTQIIVALAIAVLSDVLSAFVTVAPPVAWGVDVATVVLLFLVLGWNWLLLPGLVMEAIPGFGVLPCWCVVVVAIAVWGTARPKLRGDSAAPLVALIEKLRSQT